MNIQDAEQIVIRRIRDLEVSLRHAEVDYTDKKTLLQNLAACNMVLDYLMALNLGVPIKWKRQAYYDELINGAHVVIVKAS